MLLERDEAFSDISDEKLAALAASDRSALTALMIRYDSFISAKAEAMKTAEVDSDDLFQEGIMGMLDALKAFDAGKGTSLRTFANTCIRNRMINALSKKAPHISLDDVQENINAADDEDPESIFVRREHEKVFFESISHTLTAAEWSVLQLYLKGFSYSSIAAELGISVKSADNAMQRVRRKLREILKQ